MVYPTTLKCTESFEDLLILKAIVKWPFAVDDSGRKTVLDPLTSSPSPEERIDPTRYSVAPGPSGGNGPHSTVDAFLPVVASSSLLGAAQINLSS